MMNVIKSIEDFCMKVSNLKRFKRCHCFETSHKNVALRQLNFCESQFDCSVLS